MSKESLAAVARPTPVEQFTILLATAGDADSIGAVRVAVQLARRLHAVVEVLTLATPFPHAASKGIALASPAVIDEESRKSAVEAVRRQLRAVRGAAHWPVHSRVGWPAGSIIDAARRWNASLTVLGIGDHSILSRLFGSETAVSVAKHALTPTLAVPPELQRAPVNAFAAIDFTSASINGAMLAAKLLPQRGTLTLVHSSVFAKASAEPGTLTDIYSQGAHDRLAHIAKKITRATHRRVTTMTVDGPVAESMLEIVDARRGDLIALGSHERALVDRLLLGSVRSQILRHAGCCVLVVPQRPEVAG